MISFVGQSLSKMIAFVSIYPPLCLAFSCLFFFFCSQCSLTFAYLGVVFERNPRCALLCLLGLCTNVEPSYALYERRGCFFFRQNGIVICRFGIWRGAVCGVILGP
ncbi:hypothetical protein B9Z19DRAFT_1089496, partial [Tuber borchii]